MDARVRMGSMSERSENTFDETVDRLRREGHAALAELFTKHRERLRRMVDMRLDRRVAGRVDASDVLQEAFVDASKQLERYLRDVPMPPFLWLRFLTGERLMATHRRHLGAKMRDAKQEVSLRIHARPDVRSESLSFGLAGKLTSPSVAAVRAEVNDRLRKALDELEVLDREILSLRHFEELSNTEAAEELEITTAAASKRYIRALERLRKAVEGIPGLSWGG
jgi:RNA polymerase sigma-70 factor, ECF subfamily